MDGGAVDSRWGDRVLATMAACGSFWRATAGRSARATSACGGDPRFSERRGSAGCESKDGSGETVCRWRGGASASRGRSLDGEGSRSSCVSAGWVDLSLQIRRRRRQLHRDRLLGDGTGIHQRLGHARPVSQLLSTDLALQVEFARCRLHYLLLRPGQRRAGNGHLGGGIGHGRPRCLQRQDVDLLSHCSCCMSGCPVGTGF